MKLTSTMIRIRLSTYRKLRRIFKAERGETCANYFERLSKYLEKENEKR